MEIRKFDTLPESAIRVRTAVFVEEQGFVNELDGTDQVAVHFVAFDGEKPVAACRLFWEEQKEAWILGRLAVLKSYRGKQLGAEMMRKAEEYVREKGGRKLALHAQCRAMEFYRKQGYAEAGDVGYDEGCPHMWMYKNL